MFKIKFLKEYTYMSICDIDFNVIVDFDCENEVELYSLRFEDHNYNSGDFLINFAKNLDDETLEKEIKTFMLNYIQSQVNCHIEDSDCNEWAVETTDDGLKLENKTTNRCIVWKVHDLEDDCEFIQDEMIKFLNLQASK